MLQRQSFKGVLLEKEMYPKIQLNPSCEVPVQQQSKLGYTYFWELYSIKNVAQPAFTFSKLTIETLEQGVEYLQS